MVDVEPGLTKRLMELSIRLTEALERLAYELIRNACAAQSGSVSFILCVFGALAFQGFGFVMLALLLSDELRRVPALLFALGTLACVDNPTRDDCLLRDVLPVLWACHLNRSRKRSLQIH